MVRRREEEKFLDVSAAMQGSLVFSDPVNLRINGKFEGTLTTKGNLIIGRSADVKADIIGENITVSGQVRGNITASAVLSLTASARVIGNVEIAGLSIEEGAVFNGKCKMIEGKISLEELSDYLSIEENKIMEWVEGGKIPVESEGDKLLFDRKEVETWIARKN
ncbi:MAG: polymer-forming cytoskeletal protein [Candidatus Omnitrophica bacterium]|nr:polymer-forming cytoskeletal protein [Candidatus Omnitrophota bacterium]